MTDAGPMRRTNDLADMVEMLLDKGVVVNADIAVTIGETELLSVKIRAAIASFETAAQYGLEFPDGTDPERIETAASTSRGLRQDTEPGAHVERGEGESGPAVESEAGRGVASESTDKAEKRSSGPRKPAIRPRHAEGHDDEN